MIELARIYLNNWIALTQVEVKAVPADAARSEIISNWLEAIAVAFILELTYFLTSVSLDVQSPLFAMILLVIGLIEFFRIAVLNFRLHRSIKAIEKK
jgi:hypothetical protein